MDPFEQLRKSLEQTHAFPAVYTFKFISPRDKLDAVQDLLGDRKTTTRPSRTGKYVSVTCECMMYTSNEIIDVYRAAQAIPGVISL